MVITTELGREGYAEIMVAVLQFARTEPEDILFGPFVEKMLLEGGLIVQGETDRLEALIRETIPHAVITHDG